MLQFAGGADDGALAIALDRLGIAAHRREQALRHGEGRRA
jgi:hypothetical protein